MEEFVLEEGVVPVLELAWVEMIAAICCDRIVLATLEAENGGKRCFFIA